MVRRLILASSISVARRFIHGMTYSWNPRDVTEITIARPSTGMPARKRLTPPALSAVSSLLRERPTNSRIVDISITRWRPWYTKGGVRKTKCRRISLMPGFRRMYRSSVVIRSPTITTTAASARP